jgi:hypothetical protein
VNAVTQRNTRHIVSEIDIQLWAREQRRRWLTRTFDASLRKLARMVAEAGLRAMPRLVTRAATASLLKCAGGTTYTAAPGAGIKPLWCGDHQTRYRLGPSAALLGFSTGPAR